MSKAFRATLVLVIVVLAGARQAVVAAEPAEECQQFVQKFYDWYLAREKALTNEKSQKLVEEVALRQKRSYFSPGLIKALEEDLTAERKSPDEIVGLDFDPFLNSQEMPEKCVVGEVRAKDDHYLVDVFEILDGKKDSKPTVVAELARQKNGQWIFSNFHYENDNLVGVLENLKKERATR